MIFNDNDNNDNNDKNNDNKNKNNKNNKKNNNNNNNGCDCTHLQTRLETCAVNSPRCLKRELRKALLANTIIAVSNSIELAVK